jgi:hypothetical protein
MDYRLELLSEDDFEILINRICQEVLGTGIITFSKGKDGGRDGKFTGTSQRFPSYTAPWVGKFIIQAKHTGNPIASCSDNDFRIIVNDEIEKIKQLKQANEVDCYLLFTNRKYSGVKGEQLLIKIKKDTAIEKVEIIGKESLNDMYIKPNKDIIREFQLDLMHIPFDFSENEIKNIITEFHKNLPQLASSIESQVEKIKSDYDRIGIEEKNKKYSLSKEYYENEVLAVSLQDFDKIASFLSNPINEDLKEQFYDIAAELRNLILLKRDNFSAFEEIFIFIYKKAYTGRDMRDMRGKRHLFTLLHYMYCECLIGLK